jgi:ribosomal-protein-alanine N-acetyltransferase
MQDGPTSVFEKQPRVILTTRRLILRTATEPDIKVMWERILGDGDVMRYVFQGVPMTLERAGEVVRKFFTFGDTLTGIAILTEKSTAEIIGFAGLFPCAALGADDFEIGFVLARQAWAGALPPRSARPNLRSGSNSSIAAGCSAWPTRKMGHLFMPSKSSE